MALPSSRENFALPVLLMVNTKEVLEPRVTVPKFLDPGAKREDRGRDGQIIPPRAQLT